MAVSEQRVTLEEFLQLPDEKTYREYVDGVVTRKASPQGQRVVLQEAMIRHLESSGAPGRAAEAFAELRIVFGGAAVVPDIAVYRAQRVPVNAEGEIANEFREAPDIAIEIVSPGQNVTSLVERCLWYVAHGVQIALLVDPAVRSILAFQPAEMPAAWHGTDRIDLHDVVPDFDLTVEQLFAALRRA